MSRWFQLVGVALVSVAMACASAGAEAGLQVAPSRVVIRSQPGGEHKGFFLVTQFRLGGAGTLEALFKLAAG